MSKKKKKGTFMHYWWECKLVQECRKQYRFLKKLKLGLPYDSANLLWVVFLKEMKSESKKDICTIMIAATLFIITDENKVPMSQSTNKDDAVCNTYNGILLNHKMEWNSTICVKTDRPSGHWPNEISQREKENYHMTSLISIANDNNKKKNLMDTENRLVAATTGGCKMGERGQRYKFLVIK